MDCHRRFEVVRHEHDNLGKWDLSQTDMRAYQIVHDKPKNRNRVLMTIRVDPTGESNQVLDDSDTGDEAEEDDGDD
eukprot:1146678-Karenia_brevis.AAC.1